MKFKKEQKQMALNRPGDAPGIDRGAGSAGQQNHQHMYQARHQQYPVMVFQGM